MGIESFEVRDGAALEQRIGEADVLVISGLWRNELLPRARRLRLIQSIGAGIDQFSREALKRHQSPSYQQTAAGGRPGMRRAATYPKGSWLGSLATAANP
jgi:phosphoglycerate dehydrogenase-like enzyme